MRICIIEDEQSIAEPLQRILEKHGFAVDVAADGELGLRYIQSTFYDCIILDINLPKISGIECIRKLRAEKNMVPIIMLTARSQVYDKIEGFDLGADDYITKPFHVDELIARIRAVIKRSSDNKESILRFGNYILWPEKNSIEYKKNGAEKFIELTSKETAILEYLLRNANRIVSTEELLEHVWDREVDLFTDTVKTHIKTLRQKIDPNKKIISTIRGKGYTLHI